MVGIGRAMVTKAGSDLVVVFVLVGVVGAAVVVTVAPHDRPKWKGANLRHP